MTHEEFLEKYCMKKGAGATMYYYPDEDRWIGAQHISRQTGLTQEEFYKKVTGIEGACSYCKSPTEFRKLSRGFSAVCSDSCRIKLAWLNNRDKMKAAVISNCNIDSPYRWSDPDFVYKKNLGHYRNYDSINFYIVANKEFFKFGLARSLGRIEHIRDAINGKVIYSRLMDKDLACRVEAEFYSLGVPYDKLDILENDGKLELRSISYLDEFLKLLNSITR